jgi:hypothetical protein
MAGFLWLAASPANLDAGSSDINIFLYVATEERQFSCHEPGSEESGQRRCLFHAIIYIFYLMRSFIDLFGAIVKPRGL